MLLDGQPLATGPAGPAGLPPPGADGAPGPAGALNPRHTVYESVAEGLRLHGLVGRDPGAERDRAGRRRRCPTAGLRPPERLFLRYPHELSGGQRQRVLIAGALALRPELLIADEPVSSLDASIRGEILALLLQLRDELGLGVLVVTHDLGLAWNIADRIAVMYLGRVVEVGPTEEVLTAPRHPYTAGAAVGRAGDRARSSRSCSAGRSPTRPGSRPAAGSTRAAPRSPTARPSGRGGGRLPRDARCRCCPADERPPRRLPPGRGPRRTVTTY